MKEKHLYSFGKFTLNAEDHILTREGQNVPVTPKMFDLLLVLVQNPGRVLGKEFLLQSVWPDSFVEEGNITFNIRQLRKALDDDAQAPRFIETIPRRGYRFVAAVDMETTVTPDKEEAPLGVEESPDAGPGISRPRARSIRFALLTGGAAAVVFGALSLGSWFLKNPASASSILETPFKSEKLSTDGGVFHIAISPDGKKVVYTHRSAGKQSLWLRQLDDATNVPITPASEDFYLGLVISPDGNNVYFARGTRHEPMLSVYRMPIIGGVPQKIADGTQGWISLSPDGEKISFVRCPYTDDDYCSLFVADSRDGANEKRLVTRPRPIRIGDNKISPDGRSVAFAVGQSRTSSNDFTAAAVDIETRTERQLTTERFFNINYFAWLPDQSGILMTAMQLPDRNYRIWRIGTPGGETSKLTSDSESYSRLGLDASGSLLVSTQVEPDFRLRVYNIESPTTPPRVLGNANTVAFGPDGRLYFSSARTSNFEIWSVNADGSDLRQLTNDGSSESVPFLSNDGKTVFFLSDRTGVLQVWQMSADGTNQRQLTKEEGGVPVRMSPDGAWLYYRSALKNNLRRVSVGSGQEEVVLPEMGRAIIVSPDTTRVAFSQRRGGETILTLASLPDGNVLKTWRITSAPNLAHVAWSADGQYLAYVLTDDAREVGGLWIQRLNEDSPRQIADLSGDEIAELQAFALAHDGRSFALIKGNWKHDAVLLRGLKGN